MLSDDATISAYGELAGPTVHGLAADVLRSFGGSVGAGHVALIGGIVPGLRVAEPPEGTAEHIGTADLDFHFSLQLMQGETADYYRSVIEGLQALKLEPVESIEGHRRLWQWAGSHRGTHLQVDLVCPTVRKGGQPVGPTGGSPAEVNVGPSGEITALQLGFGALVPLDTLEVPVRVQTSAGGLTYPFPVAGMLPWMCLKSDALVFRDKPKDGYDIVWLVAGLGPEVVADEVTWSPVLTSDHRERAIAQLNLLITDQFADVDSVGPVSYATFMEAPDDPSLRRYALEAVRTFGAALSGSGI